MSGYKTYAGNIPSYLQNRLQSLVTFLLEMQLKYNVSFGDNETFCSCSCWDFRRTRLLCKHFFPIIESGRKQFNNLTKLFLNYPFTNLDRDLFKENEIDNVAYPALITDKWKKCEEKIEEKHVVDIMDSWDFENASGKNSFWFFSISYSGSDKFLFGWDCVNFVNYRNRLKVDTLFWNLQLHQSFSFWTSNLSEDVPNSKYSNFFGLFFCNWHTPQYFAEFCEKRSSRSGNNEHGPE